MTPQTEPTGSFGQEPIDRVQAGENPENVAIELLERVFESTYGRPKQQPQKPRQSKRS